MRSFKTNGKLCFAEQQLLLLPRDLLYMLLRSQQPKTPPKSLVYVRSQSKVPRVSLRPAPKSAQVDALFADLLSDDPPLRPRGPAAGIITTAFASRTPSVVPACATASSAAATSTSNNIVAAHASTAKSLPPAHLTSAITGTGHKEVTVTTTKDFAGQLVNVTRTVAVGSDEHKKLIQVCRTQFSWKAPAPPLRSLNHRAPAPSSRSRRARVWSQCWACWARRKRQVRL
jgi:hypothetical protein